MIDIIKVFITYGFLAAMCAYFGLQSYQAEPRGPWQWFGVVLFALLTALCGWMAVKGFFA